MNEIVIIISCLISLIIIKIGLNIQIKKIINLRNRTNKELDNITCNLPEDKKICEEILKKLGNTSKVTIKKDEQSHDCLYLVFNNSILIGKFKANFIRIQTIAHECIHSIQNKRILWFNYLFSSIYITYFIIISILTIFNKISNSRSQIIVLLLAGIIQYVVRAYLENEAMEKAPFIAREYLIEKNVSVENVDKLIKEYNEINSIGIPFTNYYLIFKNILNLIIYCICILIAYII